MTQTAGTLALCALAPNSWNGQWVNRQQLLSRIGRHHNVVYSTGAWFSWDRGTAECQASAWTGRFTAQDNVLVDQPPRFMMRWPRVAQWDHFVVSHQAARMRRAAEGSTRASVISYLCHPQFLQYVRPLRGDRLVYHVYDLYSHQPGWNEDLATAEATLLRDADLVFCPTMLLADELKTVVDREIRILPNAADVKLIDAACLAQAPDPADLAGIAHPRIGYVGSIHPQLDLDLVATLAERNRAWQFVFIGPESKTDELHASAGYRRCRHLSNLHFLGSKHREAIPSYLINMDVHIMCYRANVESWTKVAHPLKLHEYLASGRPIVSVELPAVKEMANLIAFATGPQQWECALAAAIASGSPGTTEQRRAMAAENDWDSRANVLRGWLEDLVQTPAT